MCILLFDLDNTLLDFSRSETFAVNETLLHLGVNVSDEILARYKELNARQWELLEKGLVTRKEVKVRRYELLFGEMGLDYSPESANGIYDSFLGNSYYYIDCAEEVLQTLSRTYSLYMVTNVSYNIQKGRIKDSGIAQYFKDIFISELIGYDKPSIEFFNHCFARIPHFTKEKTYIIGDSLTSDILGGKNAGIQTVWFNPLNVPNLSGIIPDYEIRELQEIYSIVKST